MRVSLVITVALLAVSLSGCVNRASVAYNDGDRHYHDGGRYYDDGPPPHAPAHGYRAKHHRHNMVYDARLRAYVVLGYHDYYYNDGLYFRYRDGLWEINAQLSDRDWRKVDYYRVPEGLRYSKRDKRKDKRRDDHPGKGKANGKDKDKDRDRY